MIVKSEGAGDFGDTIGYRKLFISRRLLLHRLSYRRKKGYRQEKTSMEKRYQWKKELAMTAEEKKQINRKRRKKFFTRIFVFFTVFFAVIAVIQIDEAASSTIGNESFFSSYFVRTGEREVEIKILGFHAHIVDGLIVFDEEK